MLLFLGRGQCSKLPRNIFAGHNKYLNPSEEEWLSIIKLFHDAGEQTWWPTKGSKGSFQTCFCDYMLIKYLCAQPAYFPILFKMHGSVLDLNHFMACSIVSGPRNNCPPPWYICSRHSCFPSPPHPSPFVIIYLLHVLVHKPSPSPCMKTANTSGLTLLWCFLQRSAKKTSLINWEKK